MTRKSQRECTGLAPLVCRGLQSGTVRHHLEIRTPRQHLTFIYSMYVFLHAIQAALLPFLDLEHNLALSSLYRKLVAFFFFFFCVISRQNNCFPGGEEAFLRPYPAVAGCRGLRLPASLQHPHQQSGWGVGWGSFCLECWALKSVPCTGGQGLAVGCHLAFKTKCPAMCLLKTKTKIIWLLKIIKNRNHVIAQNETK